MSEEAVEFTDDDLYGLACCLRDMDEMLVRYAAERSDKAVRYAVIKTFELTYEMVTKTLRKYLARQTLIGDAANEMLMQDLIRAADRVGIMRSGWPAWRNYRENQGRTVHTYGESIAASITEGLPEFSKEVHALLSNLKGRLGQRHD